MDRAERILGVPFSLIEDSNYPQEIALPPTMSEMPTSSSPQYTLYRFVRHLKPKRILEIGTQLGASAVAMALAQRDNGDPVSVDCIDPFLPCGDNDGKSSLGLWYETVNSAGFLAKGIRLYVALSQDVMPHFSTKFDLVIVDGSHEYPNVWYDFATALKLTHQGGHIWLHDYIYYEPVRRACQEVIAAHQIPFAVNDIQTNERGDLCGWAIARNIPIALADRMGNQAEAGS